MRLLQAIKDHHKGVLCRLDVSVDYLTSDPDQLFALAEDVRRCALLRWRPKGWMSDEGGTTRWVYFAGRRRPNRNFLLYADRPSKTGGTANVLHLELRFLRAAVIRRGGYEDPASLIGLDPSVPFSTNIKLVDFDPLPRLSKKVRKTVQYYRRDPASEFSENYYETIPDRVEKLWARLDMHRAQGYQNIFRDAFSGTPGFSLPVPEKLTFFTPSG